MSIKKYISKDDKEWLAVFATIIFSAAIIFLMGVWFGHFLEWSVPKEKTFQEVKTSISYENLRELVELRDEAQTD